MKKVLILVGIGIVVAFVGIMFRNVIKYVAVKAMKSTFGVMVGIDKKYREKYEEMKAKDESEENKEENES